MAAVLLKTAVLQAHLLRQTIRNLPSITQVRNKIYHVHYQEPIINKTELFEPLPESDDRRYKPIKSARSEQTTSLFYNQTKEKFINMVMKAGNKTLARGIVDKMYENIKQTQVEKYNNIITEQVEKDEMECNPEIIFLQAIENIKPVLILTNIRKGGVMYQVPIACGASYQRYRAMKWLIDSCRDKERKIPMGKKLAWEVLDAYKNEGKCIRKKQELLRLCEANRAYAHFRWG